MLRRFILSSIVAGFLTACATQTALDQFWYPSESISIPADDAGINAVCEGLTQVGYRIDDLQVRDSAVLVEYPDGTTEQYPVSGKRISVMLLTGIHRDFNNPSDWSDEEVERLMVEAQDFCREVQGITQATFGSSAHLILTMQDWTVGARAIASTSVLGDCSSLHWQSLSYGSYGDDTAGMTCAKES